MRQTPAVAELVDGQVLTTFMLAHDGDRWTVQDVMTPPLLAGLASPTAPKIDESAATTLMLARVGSLVVTTFQPDARHSPTASAMRNQLLPPVESYTTACVAQWPQIGGRGRRGRGRLGRL